MTVIYKFPLAYKYGYQKIIMPKGSVIIATQLQSGKISLWAIVNRDNESENCRFFIAGTGHDLPEQSIRFVGTAQLECGEVMHIFKVRE